ncbi:helix-turn-helix domain-containing protein [Bacillus mycoides]|uniref:helix-turn-helix domain-containing protein n=1 Tax=Bacillus mycoides TaxID=1405 RepID=UPI0035573801
MNKFSLDTKINAIEHYLYGMDSYKTTAKKLKVNISRLKEWVALYQEHAIDGLLTKNTNYDVQFNMDAINYINDTFRHAD